MERHFATSRDVAGCRFPAALPRDPAVRKLQLMAMVAKVNS